MHLRASPALQPKLQKCLARPPNISNPPFSFQPTIPSALVNWPTERAPNSSGSESKHSHHQPVALKPFPTSQRLHQPNYSRHVMILILWHLIILYPPFSNNYANRIRIVEGPILAYYRCRTPPHVAMGICSLRFVVPDSL